MDPSFWGPSAWRLLHLLGHGGQPAARTVFESLGQVLPCVSCRESVKEFLADYPPPTVGLAQWIYALHNKVNAKLRSQGKATCEDPSYESVQKVYAELLSAGCSRVQFEGWDFLFCIASAKTGTARFWKALGDALPFEEWRAAWKKAFRFGKGKVTIKTLWKVRRSVERSLDIVNGERYEHLCKRLMVYRAGCSGHSEIPGRGCTRKAHPLAQRQTRKH